MTKKILTVALICLLCVSVLFGCNKNKDEEEILPAQTISISTASELVEMQKYTGIKYSKYVFELKNDIDLSGIEIWEPIGKGITAAFMGKFDGKGYAITNLTLKGWEGSGNPIFVGSDYGIEDETSYCSVGLFGYTKNAEISNLSLNNINIYYYTEGAASYTAALVGYDAGASKFTDISSDGKIRLSNVYSSAKTYDNSGDVQGTKENCDTTQYIGGVVAYSGGNSIFSNISSSVSIENSLYKAIYRQADEEKGIQEGYSVRSDDDSTILPEQTLAGGVFGMLKSATLENITSSAKLKVKAKSSYLGGAVAAFYNSTAKNFAVDNVQIEGKVSNKNIVGGAIGLLDYSVFSESEISNVTIIDQCQGFEVQSVSAGGAVGYVYDNSTVKDIAVDKLTIESMYNKSIMGGILGVIRDSVLKDCSVSEGKFIALGLSADKSKDVYDNFFAGCAVIVGEVFGNASVSSCQGSIGNKYTYNYREEGVNKLFDDFVANTSAYATKNSTVYVNEDGFDAIRLFKENSLTEYIVAYAKYSSGVLDVVFYSEESKILSEQSYNNVVYVAGSESDSTKYINVFFTAGEGIKGSDGTIITFEKRETTKYVHLSGIPNVDEATLNVIA